MIPVVVIPDVEQLVVEHLTDELPDYWDGTVTVGTRKPNPATGDIVWVRRVGGTPHTEVSDAALVDLLVYADTDERAHDLTAIVRALLWKMRADRKAYRIAEFAGPSRFADPDSDTPRWLLTVELAVRGSTLEALGS